MADELDRIEERARAAARGESVDRVEVASELERLPGDQARSVLERVAREEGAAGVPLLEELATVSSGALALAATRFLGDVRAPLAASALDRLSASSPDPSVRKAARRELHRLASLGITLAAAPPQQAPTREAPRAVWPVYRALASPVDGAGNRGIWFAFRRGADIDLVSLLVSDQAGIKDVATMEMSEPRFEREARGFLEDEYLPWVDMPADYCRHLVEEYHARNASSGTSLPLEYLAWRQRIGPPEQRYEQLLVYSVINAAEVRWDPRFLDTSGDLFDMPMFQGWILDRAELEPFLREMAMSRQAGLVLAGLGDEARERMVVDRAIQALFDASRRALYRRRLEEDAYVLWKLDRGYQARQALAAAMALEPPDRSLQDHGFVRRMVEWSLEAAMESVRGERTKAVKPGVRLHLPY